MTDQSPTREEKVAGVYPGWRGATQPCDVCGTLVAVNAVSPSECGCSQTCGEILAFGLRDGVRALIEAVRRSDSQRIAELEGRLRDGASSAETAAAGAVARLPREIGSPLEGDDL